MPFDHMIIEDRLTSLSFFAIFNMQMISDDHIYVLPRPGMSLYNDQRKFLYKLAVSYYEDGLTQKQIGKRFGLSRIKVSRLLRQARDLKVVQISIMPLNGSNADLERALAIKYGIDEVVTITPAEYTRQAIARALGLAAAENLVRCIQGRGDIAITWGSTLNQVMESMPAAHKPNVRILQALGGLSSPDTGVNGADLARRMAQSFGATPLLLPSPGLVANREVRDALLLDPQISKMIALAAKADIALVGIGILAPDSVVIQNNILNQTETERLKAKGAVGDIGLRFYDHCGKAIEDDINDRIIGLDLDQYRKIKRVIGIAGGEQKVESIRATLRGKLINVLITDDQTARKLIEED
jgi:DNA-binding transcriptional regulator LsrR (DeoR family)